MVKLCAEGVQTINDFLTDPDNAVVNSLMKVIEKYGGVDEINRKAGEAGKLENLMARLRAKESPYVKDLEWLAEQRDKGAFISIADYRRKILGGKANSTPFDESFAVALEISALPYLSWLISEAKQTIENQELMPGRFIRVRCMKEQEMDNDLLAVIAAMKIIGASWVEYPDTKGTDGSNIHIVDGPDTIVGYFGGVGQPNDYPIKWADEYLYYYTNYGVEEVLNANAGTVLVGCLLRKLGINNKFKISVIMGIDNPFSFLGTAMLVKLLSRDDETGALFIGLNFSNSVNKQTIELCAEIRKALGLEDIIRLEHHVLESAKGIVHQPYDRRDEVVELAAKVKNFSAKHEGADIEVEKMREHPSNFTESILSKEEVLEKNLMDALLRNYLDKHDAVNRTAEALTRKGLAFIAAKNLHR